MEFLKIDPFHKYAAFAHPVEKTVLLRSEGVAIAKKIAALDVEIGRIIVDPLCTNVGCLGHFREYGFLEMGLFEDRVIFSINVRKAVRGVVLNDKREVLLIHMKSDPEKFNQRGFDSFWLTPGGKVESSETQLEALVREIREETGITDLVVKQALFSDEKTLIWDGFPVRLFNHYYLVHTSESKIENTALVDYEKELILGYKWWTQKELSETKEVIFPPDLNRWLQNT